ncbi:RNA polymerase factor sigma-32 [bacterium]|nr:RNA polymerase factor sigma-32 [bacterium]
MLRPIMTDAPVVKKKSSTLPSLQSGMDHYMQEIGQLPVLSREEEYDLAMRWYKHKDRDAAEKLVISNLRFVVKIAREYAKYGVNMSELIQEGNLGLMHAVQKYDPEKGFRLISYAVWWIRAYIQAFVLRSWSIVRTGTTRAQRKLFSSLQKARKEVSAMNPSAAPTNKQLAAALDMEEEDFVATMARIQSKDMSLDQPLGNDGDEKRTFGDTLEDESSDIESQLVSYDLSEIVKDKLDSIYDELKPRERLLLEKRLLSDDPMTLEAIGQDFGVTRERVRQIESRLMDKLKKHLLPAVGNAYLKQD